jgi:hypothetical protein
MRRLALLPLAVALMVPAAAQAGGWATVELDQAPSGIVAGTPWRVELIVKQHGITPLEGVTPSVRIANDAGVVRTFPARPAGRPGHYVADVTYPAAGTWRTRFFDGFTDAMPHRLSPITVAAASGSAPASASASPDGFPWEQTIAIAVVALLWMGGWIAGYGWPHPHLRARSSFHLRPRRTA